MNRTPPKRTFSNAIKLLAKSGLGLAFAVATLASLPSGAKAGFIGLFAGRLAERVAEHQAEQRSEGHFRGPVLVPGRDGPLAPSSEQGFSACPYLFPRSTPINVGLVNAQWRAVGLCSNHFAVLTSVVSKTPLVVVEKLNRSMLSDAKGQKRSDEFYPDPRLARGARAELVDFRSVDEFGKRYQRGHLANAADQPDPQSMVQSFALSNTVPQDPFNNEKTWAKIESDVRKFARRAQGDVFVFSGPIFRGPLKTIGPNRVWVPSHLFKLVYDEASGRSWAYILANTAEARVEAPVDYAEFARQTGWKVLGPVPG